MPVTKEQLQTVLEQQYAERDNLKAAYYAAKQEAQSREEVNKLRDTYYTDKNLLYDRIRTTKYAIDALEGIVV